jgi:predicted lipoprotein with Yx(FWY)xxD motif
MHTRGRSTGLLAATVALIALVAFVIAGCGASSTMGAASATNTPTAGGAGTPTPIIMVATANVGGASEMVLTDHNGLSLYYFDLDTSTTSACTSTCSQDWPAFLFPSGTPGSASALPGQITTGNTGNGRQVLYNGHPLYHFSGDAKAGDTNGNGVGGKWHIATPNTPAAVAATSTPSGTSNTPTPNPYNY